MSVRALNCPTQLVSRAVASAALVGISKACPTPLLRSHASRTRAGKRTRWIARLRCASGPLGTRQGKASCAARALRMSVSKARPRRCLPRRRSRSTTSRRTLRPSSRRSLTRSTTPRGTASSGGTLVRAWAGCRALGGTAGEWQVLRGLAAAAACDREPQLCDRLAQRPDDCRHLAARLCAGSYVTHETKHFIYFYLGQVAVLLFKSG